jgi:hypothetical protein
MSSSESKLNVTPEAVRLVAEGLSSELLLWIAGLMMGYKKCTRNV